MKVQAIMTQPAMTVGVEMPVLEAQRLMASHRIRHLPVTRGGRLMGIVTDRDIRLNLPSPATSLSIWEINYLLARLTVESVMRNTVITVDPHREAAEAAQIIAVYPQALQLRYLQTLGEVATENNSTIVFPLPIDLLRPFLAASAPSDNAKT